MEINAFSFFILPIKFPVVQQGPDPVAISTENRPLNTIEHQKLSF